MGNVEIKVSLESVSWKIEWKDEGGDHQIALDHLEIRTPVRTSYGSLVTTGVLEICPTESKGIIKAIGMPSRWK